MNRLCVLLLGIALSSLSAYGSIRITENSPTRLTFHWELNSLDTGSFRDSTIMVSGLGFHDANITLGSAGTPAIPGFSFFAGVPASGAVTVSFTPTDARTIRLNHPLRRQPRPGKGQQQIDQGPVFSDNWISIPQYTWFKNMRAVHLVIRPFLAGSDGQTIRMVTQGECTIQFPPAAAGVRRPAASPYQRMLEGLLLNYPVASSWMTVSRKSSAKAADSYPLEFGNSSLRTFTIGDGHAGMNEMTTKENGVLKISGAQALRVLGAAPGDLKMGDVVLYASQKGTLPEAVPAAGVIPPGLVEIPLFRCDVNNDGVVDTNDYFLACVTGLHDWVWDSNQNDFTYSVDPYDDNRHYWLCREPLADRQSMPVFRQPSRAVDTMNYFVNHLMLGQPSHLPVSVSDGIPSDEFVTAYVWQRICPGNANFDYALDLPHIDETAPGSVTFQIYGGADLQSAQARVGSDTICLQCYGNRAFTVRNWGDKHLRINYTGGQNNWWQLQSVQVEYREPLSIFSDVMPMRVFSSKDSGLHAYRLAGGDGKTFVFRIPQNETGISLIDSSSAGGVRQWCDSGNTGVTYVVTNESGFMTLPDESYAVPAQRLNSTTGFAVQNLRDVTNRSDYLIITAPLFLSQAERLAAHKARCGFRNPKIVSVNDIYTDFAGGNMDPVAIRNFLAFVARNWQDGDSLDYVVLMGKGHLDFKQVSTADVNYIPPYEAYSNSVEDFFVSLTPGTGGKPSMGLGRIPCQTVAQASAVVDKIIALEDSTADWGPWRNTMLFVADDDMQKADHDPISGNDGGHHWSSELCASAVDTLWPSMDMRKVYLFDYPWNAGWEKPEASTAIVNYINSGVGYVNFFGHGSPSLWTDEHVLRPSVIPLLLNAKQYPLVCSFSCAVGEFDYPGVTCLSELLLEAPQAGASATFSATRSVSAISNTTLAQALYVALFQHARDTVRKLDTLVELPLGMAMVAAKSHDYSTNSSYYSLLGDPSLQIIPYARVTRVRVTDLKDHPLDTLKALQQIKITGAILNQDGSADASFGSTGSATAQTTFFNPAYLSGRKDGGADTSVRYMEPGTPVFSGRTQVQNDSFQQTLILPRNLSFNTPYPRLITYAWNGPRLAIGVRDSLIFSGTDTSFSSAKDTTGPSIRIRPVFDNPSMRQNPATFTDHLTSTLPLKAEVLVNDPNGINVTGTGPDEGLTMEVPGCLARSNIDSRFQFTNGDYRQGSAIISFDKNSLKTGAHTLYLSAQDLFGNITKTGITLNIVDSNSLPTLDHVFNAPNPMRMGQTTRFFYSPSITTTYDPSYSQPIQFTAAIKIYSLSGRLLYVKNNLPNGASWDGRDQTGYPLPPDVYLYQITLTYPNGTSVAELGSSQTVKSKVQKLVIYPPKR